MGGKRKRMQGASVTSPTTTTTLATEGVASRSVTPSRSGSLSRGSSRTSTPKPDVEMKQESPLVQSSSPSRRASGPVSSPSRRPPGPGKRGPKAKAEPQPLTSQPDKDHMDTSDHPLASSPHKPPTFPPLQVSQSITSTPISTCTSTPTPTPTPTPTLTPTTPTTTRTMPGLSVWQHEALLGTSYPRLTTLLKEDYYVRLGEAMPTTLPTALAIMSAQLLSCWSGLQPELERLAGHLQTEERGLAVLKRALEQYGASTYAFDVTAKAAPVPALGSRIPGFSMSPSQLTRTAGPGPGSGPGLGKVESPVKARGGPKGGSKKAVPKPSARTRDKPPTGSQKSVATAKPVVPNQISATVFWNHVELFFRGISEQDLNWLDLESCIKLASGTATQAETRAAELSQDIAEYLVLPPLGCALAPLEGSSQSGDGPSLFAAESMEGGQLGPGGLTSRLLASLVEERLLGAVVPSVAVEAERAEDVAVVPSSTLFSYRKKWVDVETRIRQELFDLGILRVRLAEDKAQGLYEDDEVCGALRQLQAKLRLQNALNRRRKRQLFEYLLFKANVLSTQEYYLVMEEIYKKLDLLYQQRKKGGGGVLGAGGGAAGASASGQLGQFKRKKKSMSGVARKLSALAGASVAGHAGGSTLSPLATSETGVRLSLDELCWELLHKKDLLRKEFQTIVPYRFELLPEEARPDAPYSLPVAMTPCSSFCALHPEFRLQLNSSSNRMFGTDEELAWIKEEQQHLPLPIIEDETLFSKLPALSSMVDPFLVTSSVPKDHYKQHEVSLMGLPTKLTIGKKKIKLVVGNNLSNT